MTLARSMYLPVAAGCAAAWLSAAAEPMLADPTRPPGAMAAAALPAHPGSALAAPSTWPALRALRIAPHGESSALLDGRVVRVGERAGDAVVLAIDADGVVLRRGGIDRRLALLPATTPTHDARPPPPIQAAVAAATKEHP